MWSFLGDLTSLPGSLVDSISKVGGEELANHIATLQRNIRPLSSLFPNKGGKIRKVVGIPDKGKSRTIAILDYFSQAALRPVHFFLFGILRKIPQDVTFDQGAFLEKVQSWGNVKYYSIDLSKATDRFPIDLICIVLEGFFTKE